MSDLDELIEAGLRQLADSRTPSVPTDDVMPAVRRRVQRRHRRRVSALVVTPMLVVAAGAWALWPSGSDHTAVVTDPGPTTTTEDPESTDLPPIEQPDAGPLSPRSGVALVDLGDRRVLFWGGSTRTTFEVDLDHEYADGAVYHLDERAWTPIAPSPFGTADRNPAVAVLADGEVIAFASGAAMGWDPREDSWRVVAEGLPPHVRAAVWTGSTVLLAASDDVNGVYSWLALDPASGLVAAIPDEPMPVDQEAVVWTGDELVTIGKPRGSRGPSGVEGNAYDPSRGSWRSLPPGPIRVQAVTAAHDRVGVVVADYTGASARYEPSSDSWTWLDHVPGRSHEALAQVVANDGHLAVIFSGSIAVSDGEGGWHPVPLDVASWPTFGAPTLLSTGEVIHFGHIFGSNPPSNGLYVADLDALVESGAIDLGVPIDLPSTARLVSTEVTGSQGASPTTRARIDLGDIACTVEVRYASSIVSSTAGTVTIEPVAGEPPWEAIRLDGSTGTAIGRGSHRIDCGSLERSVELASYIRPPDHWYGR